MADNIPEGLDDLLNSIRGNGKSQKSSAIVVVPKAQNKGNDSVENEDIDPAILRMLGLEDVFDIDYDTYKTLLREKMAAGRMADSKIPTEEVQLLTDEFKRVKSKTGRFKVKGQKIKKESFVGKKKTRTSAIVKVDSGALKKRSADVRPETQAAGESLALISDKLSSVNKNVKSAIESFVKSEKQEKKREDKERVAIDKEAKQQKEERAERSRSRSRIPNVLKKALTPVKNIFDAITETFQKLALGTVIMEIIRFLEDPTEYFRPLVNWVNNVISRTNEGIKKVLHGMFDPINKVIEGANSQLVNLENAINPLLQKVGSSPLTIPKIPVVPTQSITDKVQIPLIKYPEPKSEPSILSKGSSSTTTTATPTVGLTSLQKTALGYIKKYESAGSGGYDAMNQGTVADRTGAAPRSGNSKDILGQSITDMTLGEVIRRQDKNLTNDQGFIHAAGAYQFTGNTLPGLVKRAGLKMTDKFSPANQDRLAVQLASERGAQPWTADPRNKLQYDQKAMSAINALKGSSPAEIAPSPVKSSAPPPPKRPGATPIGLPVSGGASGNPTSMSSANQRGTPVFSATDGTNPTMLSIKSLYNIVE